jgi:hypothetical protein
MGVQGGTRGPGRVHRVQGGPGGSRGLQGESKGIHGVQGVQGGPGDPRGIQEGPGGSRGPGWYKGSREVEECPGGSRGFKPVPRTNILNSSCKWLTPGWPLGLPGVDCLQGVEWQGYVRS